MRATTPVMLAIAVLLAGCQGDSEPSPPPTSQDALTTTTATPPPSDDVEATSSAPDPTTPSDTVATTEPADESTTTEEAGPPAMPDEALEDSESGAEAFALHYVDLLNYTGRVPKIGLLEPLASDDCDACANHEATVAYSVEHGEVFMADVFDVTESVSLHNPTDSTANVRVQVTQIGQDVVNEAGDVVDSVEDQEATMAFTLAWDDGWQIETLRAEIH